MSTDAGWVNAATLWLSIPHRTQFDGTVWAGSNCGPASLAMVLEAYGLRDYANDALRGEVNRLQGDHNPDNGTSLYAISSVAQRAGLYPMGLGQRWTLDDVRSTLGQGRPIITLTRYADLPGNGRSDPGTNHYIVLSGLSGDNIIYNDPAYSQGAGRALLIPPDALLRAWANSDIPGQAVSFALNGTGAGLMSPLSMRQHLFTGGGLAELGIEPAGVDFDFNRDVVAAAQREFFWKAAILGITNRPVMDLSPGESETPEAGQTMQPEPAAASTLDPRIASPWLVLLVFAVGLLLASGTLTVAFVRLPQTPTDRRPRTTP
jgi:hypothetical protein